MKLPASIHRTINHPALNRLALCLPTIALALVAFYPDVNSRIIAVLIALVAVCILWMLHAELVWTRADLEAARQREHDRFEHDMATSNRLMEEMKAAVDDFGVAVRAVRDEVDS